MRYFSILLQSLLFFSPKAVQGVRKFLYQDDKLDPNSKAVIEVTELNGFFQTSNKDRIVEFYSPYCGHCVRFKSTYANVAAQARKKHGYDNLEFYAVSCAAMSKLCQKFDVQSYPSIFSIGAGAATNTMNNVGNMMFSVKKIEKALGLTQTTLPARELETTDDGVDGKPNNRGDSAKDDAVEGETTTEGQEDEQDGGAKNGDAEDDEENQKKENEGNVEEDEEEAPGVDEEAESDVGNIGERLGGEAVDDDKEMSKDTDFNFSEEKIPRIPVRPKAGAEVAKNGERAMDKWKEIQKQRIREKEYKMLRQKKAKPGSIGNELINNSGATAIMLANRRGTDQFNARQKDLLAVLTRMQSAQHRKHEEMLKRMKRGELVFKKHVTKPRFVEAVPIVKRAVKMTAEEQLILDASLSFREGLRVGVYKSMKPLVPKEKHALKNWLELLRISLPPEWALLETIDELDENIHRISQSPHDLITVLAKRPFPRTKWSKSCGRGNGFTCGFWKLLHIMTIGVAEHRGGRDLVDAGTVRENTRLFSPMEAANTVREYIVNFFPCTDCAQHFVAQYDQCNMNRRCDRLAGDAASATDADWKELARWLWEFHNDVNVRVLNKKLDDQRKIGPGGATMAEQVNVLWPSLDSCVTCIDEDGSFNEEGVFLYMEQTYWPGHDLKDTPRKLIWLEVNGQGSVGLNSILFVIGLVIVLILRNRVSKASFAHTVRKAKVIMGTKNEKLRKT